jgi:hypothetical protein
MSQNRDDLPWFPLYASNIVADKRYRLMSPVERFVWISILLECWPNGSVPADPVELAKYLGYSVEDVKDGLTERVLSFFKEVKGELISPQLEEYWGKQMKLRSKKSEGGKKGAKRRWDKDSNDMPQPIGVPIPQPIGRPIGSLNTIKLNTLKSNSVFKEEVIDDPWVEEYDAATNNQVKVRV